MEEDQNLVERAIGGDSRAFAELYDRYASVIRAICFDTTRELHTAQDLAQDVFLRAYSKISGLRDPTRFGPWLVSIARYVCHEWLRSKRQDRHRFAAEFPEPIDRDCGPAGEFSDELRLAMTQLSERERLVIHLHYLQQQPADEACKIVGLSHSAFYKLIARTRERLAKILSATKELS